MTTSPVQIQNASVSLSATGQTLITIPVKDPSNNLVDVSTGYTLKAAKAQPATAEFPGYPGVDISSGIIPTFHSGSVDLLFDGAAIAGVFPPANPMAVAISLSADGGSTFRPWAIVQLSITNLSLSF